MRQLTDEQVIKAAIASTLTAEEKAIGAFLGAMRDCKLDGEKMREAMIGVLGLTGEGQPAREWVGLTDDDFRAMGFAARPGAYAAIEAKLREKNAGRPAAKDKAGGEVVASKTPLTDALNFFTEDERLELWKKHNYGDSTIATMTQAVFAKLYTRPQPQADHIADASNMAPDGYSLEVVAWTVPGKITDWSKDFSAYKTKTYTRPVYTPCQPKARRGTKEQA